MKKLVLSAVLASVLSGVATAQEPGKNGVTNGAAAAPDDDGSFLRGV